MTIVKTTTRKYRTDRPEDLRAFGPEITRMEAALAHLRDSYPNMTIGALASLLALGRNQCRNWDEARSLKEIAAEIGVSYPTFARHVDILGDGVGSANGLGLVEKRIDPAGGMKERRVALAERGLSLIGEIERILSDPYLRPSEKEEVSLPSP